MTDRRFNDDNSLRVPTTHTGGRSNRTRVLSHHDTVLVAAAFTPPENSPVSSAVSSPRNSGPPDLPPDDDRPISPPISPYQRSIPLSPDPDDDGESEVDSQFSESPGPGARLHLPPMRLEPPRPIPARVTLSASPPSSSSFPNHLIRTVGPSRTIKANRRRSAGSYERDGPLAYSPGSLRRKHVAEDTIQAFPNVLSDPTLTRNRVPDGPPVPESSALAERRQRERERDQDQPSGSRPGYHFLTPGEKGTPQLALNHRPGGTKKDYTILFPKLKITALGAKNGFRCEWCQLVMSDNAHGAVRHVLTHASQLSRPERWQDQETVAYLEDVIAGDEDLSRMRAESRCDVCGDVFSRKDAMMRHRRSAHPTAVRR